MPATEQLEGPRRYNHRPTDIPQLHLGDLMSGLDAVVDGGGRVRRRYQMAQNGTNKKEV